MHGTGPSTGEDPATFEPGKRTDHAFSYLYRVLRRFTMRVVAKWGDAMGF